LGSATRRGSPVATTIPVRLSPILIRRIGIAESASPHTPNRTSSLPSTMRMPTESESSRVPHARAMFVSSSSRGKICDSWRVIASSVFRRDGEVLSSCVPVAMPSLPRFSRSPPGRTQGCPWHVEGNACAMWRRPSARAKYANCCQLSPRGYTGKKTRLRNWVTRIDGPGGEAYRPSAGAVTSWRRACGLRGSLESRDGSALPASLAVTVSERHRGFGRNHAERHRLDEVEPYHPISVTLIRDG